MGERGFGIKRDVSKQGWEENNFPIVCEVCLGDNPYIKMMQQKHGDECRICQRPYTVFRWKAGTKGRFKRTEICQTCAKVKNVCQTCIFDLQYGLPVQVRDKFLGDNKVALPTSSQNRDYWIQEQGANLNNLQLPYKDQGANPILQAQARMRNQNYERNKAHVCSFWEKGECKRGDLCPYAHEKRYDKESALAKQNIKDRFHGNNDVLANKIMNQLEEKQEKDIQPPEDTSITSIFLRNLPQDLTEQELFVIFQQYGTINSIKHIQPNFIAFINYASRKSAEDAVKDNYGNLIIKGNKIQVSWARSKGYKPQQDKGQLQYNKEELNQLNQMVDPANVPRPPNQPPQMDQEIKKQETQKKLLEILNADKEQQQQNQEINQNQEQQQQQQQIKQQEKTNEQEKQVQGNQEQEETKIN
ncbi:hypothetical protein PPERSA_10668 [Pseudocohnilembus persalinus]|uniref:Uncharacterized protein n=1 Tax=Pseudocohnilembus persalinus TaxID=266149 RepID=A0A0V0QD81_PSEPJ|nr:hypothetical protein PPERSA_10668 [Pseudocohnilembus persalinus]|eukprot:KRX00169.1 hypothetical protein PPERSA_10668 [Pseudocohnilembus persalinus]